MSVPGPGSYFDLDGWSFKPAAVPWYRTRRAMSALIAVAVAACAIVVSGVLLLLGNSPAPDGSEPTTSAPSPSADSPAPSPSLRVGVPPAPPAPPPPPPQETQQAPVYRPTQRPTATKKPEIGVTRTPVTRSPISVAPQPRHPRN
ncbi:hypothetical protein [Mycolicibacterium houstonense]|uniref:hypothetical protein n=1 Tax=Mycolicibacterium houstonense TaxID=146021 RepID=UPI00135957AE|nr:hypothetical protein [Mycolicibacterium houstonense]